MALPDEDESRDETVREPFGRPVRLLHMDEDAELVRALRSGNGRAARRLYDRHGPRVWRLTLRITQRRDLAEDCVQEAFIRAFGRIGELREAAAFGGWLLNIAYRIAVDAVRQVARDRRLATALAQESTPGSESDVLLQARLAECIDRLDDPHRQVFVLYEMLGMKHAEIADCLDIAEGSSKRRLFEARNRLRTMLEPMVGTE